MIMELNHCIEVNDRIRFLVAMRELGIPSLGDLTRQRVCQNCSGLGDQVPEECSVQLGSHEI